MSKSIVFSQKWIEDTVRKLLSKEEGEISQAEIEKIKYLRIGESFDNDFIVEMSLEEPPVPFVDTDGGDEWGYACLKSDDIPRFVDECGNDSQLSAFCFEWDNTEMKNYAYSKEAKDEWKNYKESVCYADYYEEIDEYEEWEKWYSNTAQALAEELKLFTGVKVLRIKGLDFENYNFLVELKKLEVLEFVETRISNNENVEQLKQLKQLCCWLD